MSTGRVEERKGGAGALPGAAAPNNSRFARVRLMFLVEASQFVFVKSANVVVDGRWCGRRGVFGGTKS
jgi:hypothetical protein